MKALSAKLKPKGKGDANRAVIESFMLRVMVGALLITEYTKNFIIDFYLLFF